jgi:UDP-MurNAc hydroxylase
MSIKIRYIYSASVVIETPDLKILTDPWFTQGILDGSWFHYPHDASLAQRIGRVDLIYVSHIHPDHYDVGFLRDYLGRYPETRVVIAPFEDNFLSAKMKADGIPHEVMGEGSKGDTRFGLFPNHMHKFDIDSALAVRWGNQAVVNMNDNVHNPDQIARIRAFAPDVTAALLPYCGAGAYPHTYYDISPKLLERCAWKKEFAFERYRAIRAGLAPKAVLPFAGQFILGGHLHYLNPYRGIADATEVSSFDRSAVVLADGGLATLDAGTLQASAVRTAPYDADALSRRLMALAHMPMDYEVLFGKLDVSSVPFTRLLAKAHKTALRRSQCEQDYWYCIQLGDRWFAANANRNADQGFIRKSVDDLQPRSEIYIDPRYLCGLLTHAFHWNNAEGGSQYFTRRHPDVFVRTANDYLNFLHV